MKFSIKHQESYSRGQLILRTLFGWLYIVIPHIILLIFLGIVAAILWPITFLIVLFTGKYPRGIFDFMLGYYQWDSRIQARLFNLSDGYPAFGLDHKDEFITFELDFEENHSRVSALLKFFFGAFYIGIPHGIILAFRGIACYVLLILSWFIILFTGTQPESFHKFITGQLRWAYRVNIYWMMLTDKYPPFTGEEV